MKHYKDPITSQLFAFEADGSQDAYIPENLIPITDAEAEAIRNPPKSVAALIALQLDAINTAYSATIGSIKAGIPPDEVLGWSKQEAEARAWNADNTAVTPMIDALATARGVPKAELVARILAKADAFAQFSGQLTGKRQKLEDMLNALPAEATAADVEAIAW